MLNCILFDKIVDSNHPTPLTLGVKFSPLTKVTWDDQILNCHILLSFVKFQVPLCCVIVSTAANVIL